MSMRVLEAQAEAVGRSARGIEQFSADAMGNRVKNGGVAEYVQFGCGLCAPPEWRNFDASPTLRLQRLPMVGPLLVRNGPRFPRNVEYGDVTRGLPVSNDSCRAVYCSHVLEHLALQDLRAALAETLRILRQGGVFRLVVPDLSRCISDYLKKDSPNAAIEFMRDTLLGKETRTRTLRGFVIEWLGHSHHFWMWDYNALDHELKKAGFVDVRRAHFGDAADPLFHDVEEAGRWDGCLGVEAKK